MSEGSAPALPAGFGDNRGIKFHIKTGTASYQCVLQDRSHYERKKASRTNTMDSVDSSASSSSEKSSH